MNNQKLLQASKLLQAREKALAIETAELQNQREKFLIHLAGRNFNPPFKTCEMYMVEEEVIKTKPEVFNSLNPNHNTRTKTHSETCAEIDNLDQKKADLIISELCKALLRNKIHFAVFFAEGQRSPHIRIYDFEELEELDAYNREIAQLKFWRKMAPFSIQHLDKAVLSDEHYLQMEFAPHWKYGTPFNLIYEWIPEVEKCNN